MNTRAFSYLTIAQESIAEFSDKGSKFLAIAFPVTAENDFKEKLKEIKKNHPKAAHHCFAYRLGAEGERFRSSDDGEPSSSAGRPILGQIDSRGITNTAVVVVRYFGGTLLGVPGLIHAYKSAAALALQIIPLVEKPIEDYWQVEFDYNLVNDVMTILKRHQCSILQQEMQLFCQFMVGIPRRSLDACIPQLQTIFGVTLKQVKN